MVRVEVSVWEGFVHLTVAIEVRVRSGARWGDREIDGEHREDWCLSLSEGREGEKGDQEGEE